MNPQASCAGQDPSSPAPSSDKLGASEIQFKPDKSSVSARLMQVGLVLSSVLIGGMIVFILLRKKIMASNAARNTKIKILGQRRIGPKSSVVLVEIASKQYVLGLGGDRITPIDKFEAEIPRDLSAPQ